MFTLIAENKYGQQLELTHNDAYVITNIDGLDPPDAVINTTETLMQMDQYSTALTLITG